MPAVFFRPFAAAGDARRIAPRDGGAPPATMSKICHTTWPPSPAISRGWH